MKVSGAGVRLAIAVAVSLCATGAYAQVGTTNGPKGVVVNTHNGKAYAAFPDLGVVKIVNGVSGDVVVLNTGANVKDLTIDVAGHRVSRGDHDFSLTPLEFDLLTCLARKPWQVFTREVLLQEVWGYRHAADTRLVNVHVQRLRSKIEHDPEKPEIVVTVRGVGYKAGATTS